MKNLFTLIAVNAVFFMGLIFWEANVKGYELEKDKWVCTHSIDFNRVCDRWERK